MPVLQVKISGQQMEALKVYARSHGATMTEVVSRWIDQLGKASKAGAAAEESVSSTLQEMRSIDVQEQWRGDGTERLIELAERQVELLEQLVGGGRLVEEFAEDPVNSVVPPASDIAENSVKPVVSTVVITPADSVVDEEAVAVAARLESQKAKQKAELEAWAEQQREQQSAAEAAAAVVSTPAEEALKVEEEAAAKREKAARFRAAAAAIRERAASTEPEEVSTDVQETAGSTPQESVSSTLQEMRSIDGQEASVAVVVDVIATPASANELIAWRREVSGMEEPTAPPAATEQEWVQGARDVLLDLGIGAGGDLIRSLLDLWSAPVELTQAELVEVLGQLESYEPLAA
jgi:hypothetical protein